MRDEVRRLRQLLEGIAAQALCPLTSRLHSRSLTAQQVAAPALVIDLAGYAVGGLRAARGLRRRSVCTCPGGRAYAAGAPRSVKPPCGSTQVRNMEGSDHDRGRLGH